MTYFLMCFFLAAKEV